MGIVSFNNITIYQQFMCQADRSCIWCVIYCNIVYCRHLEYNFSLLNCFLYLGQFRIYCICLYNLFQTSLTIVGAHIMVCQLYILNTLKRLFIVYRKFLPDHKRSFELYTVTRIKLNQFKFEMSFWIFIKTVMHEDYF